MSVHSWCRDIPRDEAVRAAEDGRPGPLPTLEEAIAAVTDRRPPEPGGSGNVTGLRTERVTLEITHQHLSHASAMDWPYMVANYFHRNGESVRVVEEDRPGVIDQDGDRVQMSWRELAEALRFERGQARAERDAAIRERDSLRAERITQALTADRFAAAVQEADTLRARVAELESSAKLAPAANADGGSNHAAPAASGAAGTGWLTAEEREAVAFAAKKLSELSNRQYVNGDQDAARDTAREYGILQSLLARSSPPEVVLEDFTPDAIRNLDTKYLAGWDQCMALAKRAILAAGVTMKEVGK